MQEEGSMDFQVQAKRHLDEDIEKILELAAPEVTGTERDRLKQMISTYRDVFTLTDAELGKTKLVTHRIDTGDSGPIKTPPPIEHLPQRCRSSGTKLRACWRKG